MAAPYQAPVRVQTIACHSRTHPAQRMSFIHKRAALLRKKQHVVGDFGGKQRFRHFPLPDNSGYLGTDTLL